MVSPRGSKKPRSSPNIQPTPSPALLAAQNLLRRHDHMDQVKLGRRNFSETGTGGSVTGGSTGTVLRHDTNRSTGTVLRHDTNRSTGTVLRHGTNRSATSVEMGRLQNRPGPADEPLFTVPVKKFDEFDGFEQPTRGKPAKAKVSHFRSDSTLATKPIGMSGSLNPAPPLHERQISAPLPGDLQRLAARGASKPRKHSRAKTDVVAVLNFDAQKLPGPIMVKAEQVLRPVSQPMTPLSAEEVFQVHEQSPRLPRMGSDGIRPRATSMTVDSETAGPPPALDPATVHHVLSSPRPVNEPNTPGYANGEKEAKEEEAAKWKKQEAAKNAGRAAIGKLRVKMPETERSHKARKQRRSGQTGDTGVDDRPVVYVDETPPYGDADDRPSEDGGTPRVKLAGRPPSESPKRLRPFNESPKRRREAYSRENTATSEHYL